MTDEEIERFAMLKCGGMSYESIDERYGIVKGMKHMRIIMEQKYLDQRKKDFEAGWKACESHFDPMSEIGGASMQVKADFEQYINQ